MSAARRLRGWIWVAAAGALAGVLGPAAGAAGAAVADLQPDQIVQQAFASVRDRPHRAGLDVLARFAVRLPGARPLIASTRVMVRQRVAGTGRADGRLTTRPHADLIGRSSGVTAARMIDIGGSGYLFAPAIARRPLAGRPTDFGDLWLMTNPRSPLIRFPNRTVAPAFTVVPSGDPRILRLESEVPERMAGRFVEGIFRQPGEGGRYTDEPFVKGSKYVIRRVDVDVDAVTGRLVATRILVVVRVVLGDPDLIDTAVVDLTVRSAFVPSRIGVPVRVRRPSRPASIRRAIRDLDADESARRLLANGASDMERLRERLGTYRVTLRELKVVTDEITYTSSPGARAWLREITVDRLGADRYRLTTTSHSGTTFRLERLSGVARLRGTCTRARGDLPPCRNWRPDGEIDGAAVTTGGSSLRIGVEVLRHMATAAR